MTEQEGELFKAAAEGDLNKIKELIVEESNKLQVGTMDGAQDLLTQWINKPGSQGRTPIMRAFASGDVDSVKYLLEKGANPLLVDNLGRTCLHWAMDGSADATEVLFKHGTAVLEGKMMTAVTQSNSTVLHFAVSKSRLDLVEMLLTEDSAFKALKIKDEDNLTPLELAKQLGEDDIAKKLKACKK